MIFTYPHTLVPLARLGDTRTDGAPGELAPGAGPGRPRRPGNTPSGVPDEAQGPPLCPPAGAGLTTQTPAGGDVRERPSPLAGADFRAAWQAARSARSAGLRRARTAPRKPGGYAPGMSRRGGDAG